MTTQEMINELHRVARKHEKDIVGVGETNISRMCEDVAKRLEELDKQIQEQSKVGEWIPCSERLPDVYECRVTIKYICDNGEPLYETKDAWFTGEKFKDSWSIDITELVTAWKYHSKPYKGE